MLFDVSRVNLLLIGWGRQVKHEVGSGSGDWVDKVGADGIPNDGSSVGVSRGLESAGKSSESTGDQSGQVKRRRKHDVGEKEGRQG